MKIHWNQNPLKTTVELDNTDRKQILTYIQKEAYQDILCDLDLWIAGEIDVNNKLTLEKVQQRIQEWEEICNMSIDHDEVKQYEEYLQTSHVGDCTFFSMTCSKCLAEEALGIDTIQGLDKHSGYIFLHMFGEDNTIDHVIEQLSREKAYEKKPESWKNFSDEEYEKHIPHWEAERKVALEWLKQYKEEHGF